MSDGAKAAARRKDASRAAANRQWEAQGRARGRAAVPFQLLWLNLHAAAFLGGARVHHLGGDWRRRGNSPDGVVNVYGLFDHDGQPLVAFVFSLRGPCIIGKPGCAACGRVESTGGMTYLRSMEALGRILPVYCPCRTKPKS